MSEKQKHNQKKPVTVSVRFDPSQTRSSFGERKLSQISSVKPTYYSTKSSSSIQDTFSISMC